MLKTEKSYPGVVKLPARRLLEKYVNKRVNKWTSSTFLVVYFFSARQNSSLFFLFFQNSGDLSSLKMGQNLQGQSSHQSGGTITTGKIPIRFGQEFQQKKGLVCPLINLLHMLIPMTKPSWFSRIFTMVGKLESWSLTRRLEVSVSCLKKGI